MKTIKKYLKKLINENDRIELTGMPIFIEGKTDVLLSSIFVMQRISENHDNKDDINPVNSNASENASIDDVSPKAIHERKNKILKRFDKILEENPYHKFVILGKPGSGKSTLLKHIMLEHAKSFQNYLSNPREKKHLLFPILVEVHKFENALSAKKKEGETNYNILKYLHESISSCYKLELPGNFFEKFLNTGEALLLFDGLDEIANENQRDEIQRMIHSFVKRYNDQNTVIITSRIVGYNQRYFSTPEYCHFHIADFNDDEIHRFIHKWYESKLKNKEEIRIISEDLKESLEKKPRIKELARNPLLLTIICIINRSEHQLPNNRFLLFDKASETLLYTWDKVHDIIDDRFTLEYKKRFLEKVAFHLQSMENGDTIGTLIDRKKVQEILLPDFKNCFYYEEKSPDSLVDDFLDKISSRTGLLIEEGQGQYGFVHKFFQEYFAAKYIAYESIFEYKVETIFPYIDKFIDNPFWQETLSLAIRSLLHNHAQKVLNYILERERDTLEPLLFHNLYFVMKFIAEQGSWLENPKFIEAQVDRFLTLSWNNGIDRTYFRNKTWRRFKKWVSSICDPLTLEFLKKKLLEIGNDIEGNELLRRESASILKTLGCQDQADKILARIPSKNELNKDIRQFYEEEIKRFGPNDQVEIEKIIKSRADPQAPINISNRDLIARTVRILLGIADSNETSTPSPIRCFSIETIGKFGVNDERVLARILKIAKKTTQNIELRVACTYLLATLAPGVMTHQTILDDFQQLIKDSNLIKHVFLTYPKICIKAASFNEKIKTIEEQEVLINTLTDSTVDIVQRRSNAYLIGHSGIHSENAARRLLELSKKKDKNVYLRRLCAEAAGHLGLKKESIQQLLTMVEDETLDTFTRRYCTESIHLLKPEQNEVVERLIRVTQDEKAPEDLIRYTAVAIGRLGKKKEALNILVKLYNKWEKNKETEKDEPRFIYDSLWELSVIQ